MKLNWHKQGKEDIALFFIKTNKQFRENSNTKDVVDYK